MKVITRIPVLLLVFLTLSACSHYQAGRPGWHRDTQTRERVWIAPVMMEAIVADVAIPLNRELREQVIRNRRFLLVEDASGADVELWTTIESRERESLARRSDDTGLSDVLRFDLAASYQLRSAGTEEVLKEGKVIVEGQLFREAGFNESARQRLPSMLRDLADDILQEAFMEW